MTELSTAPTTGPANSSPDDNAPSQDSGLTPAAPATASASTVLGQLEAIGWTILHSLTATTKNSAVIDHLAIGPGGIFVIDAHSWTPDLSTTGGPDQQAIINGCDALASQVRSLLPPLTRQYVVPLLTYVDASPMSMLRGSLQICTTSMLPGVITSRRPVLDVAEIDDIRSSLSSALRSLPGAASATSPSSATPSRRGFLRKNSRSGSPNEPARNEVDASAAPSPAPRPDTAAPTLAPPVVAPPVVAPPVVAPPVVAPPVVAPPVIANDASADVEPVSTPAEVTLQPAPVEAPTTAAASALANFLAQEALSAHATPQPTIEFEAEVEDVADLAVAAPVVAAEQLLPAVDDLAHPVIPTDTRWDLEPERVLEAAPTTPADLAETASAVIADGPVVPVTTPAPITAASPPPLESPVTAEAVQPTLAAAALTPAVPPPVATPPPPVAPRQPGGRRRAQAPKTNLSRLLPSRQARTSGRFSRKTSSGDADASQESDLGDIYEDFEFADAQPDAGWDVVQSDEAPGQYQFEDVEPTPAVETTESPRKQIRATDVSARSAALDDEPQLKKPKKSKFRRKPKDEADVDDDVDLSEMPANLSERGRAMYVEMQRRPKPEPIRTELSQAGKPGRAGAVRKLFVFCVIGGAIGISSSHYEEINTWVSTHVEDLPGLQKIEGPPQPEKPVKAKGKNVKDREGKGAKAGKANQ